MIKAVLWDWDNTLFDSWDAIEKGWLAVIDHFNWPDLTIDKIKSFGHRSVRDIFPALFGEREKEARDVFLETFYKYQTIKTMPGAKEVLEFLNSHNIKQGIVSNKAGDILREEVKLSGLENYFDVILGSGDSERDKPSPHGIQKALDKLNIKPADTWFIGDAAVDVEAAQAAGCISVVVHLESSCQPKQPNYFCHTLHELRHLFSKYTNQSNIINS